MSDRIPDEKRLREDLGRILGTADQPSARVRARVLARSRRRTRPARFRWRAPLAAGSLATAALLAFLLLGPDAARPPAVPPADTADSAPARRMALERAVSDPGDLNGDGRIDILDAWRLARALEEKGPATPSGDLDADGALTAEDLDRLMGRIVALDGGAS